MSPGALIAAATAAPVLTAGSGDDPAHGQPLQHAPHSPWLWVLLGIALFTVALSAVLAHSRHQRARDQRPRPTPATGDTPTDRSPGVRAATPRTDPGPNSDENASSDESSPGTSPGTPAASSRSVPPEPTEPVRAPGSPDGSGRSR